MSVDMTEHRLTWRGAMHLNYGGGEGGRTYHVFLDGEETRVAGSTHTKHGKYTRRELVWAPEGDAADEALETLDLLDWATTLDVAIRVGWRSG